MNWNRAIGEDRRVVWRIIALLLSLADLAERSCGRSRPVRRLLLWILRPAEAVALDYAIWLTRAHLAGLPAQITYELDDSIDEAARLAILFRALAAVLTALLEATGGTTAPAPDVPAGFRDPQAAFPVAFCDSS